jgi:hypothetical protein
MLSDLPLACPAALYREKGFPFFSKTSIHKWQQCAISIQLEKL